MNHATCEGKIRYSKPKNAINAMKKILASGKVVDRLGFYKCPCCLRYHVTKKFGEEIGNNIKLQKVIYEFKTLERTLWFMGEKEIYKELRKALEEFVGYEIAKFT